MSIAVALVFLGIAALLLPNFGHLPLMEPDEARNAEVAREMQASGSWIVPTYNGLAYLDKPAFFFRLVAISFSVFGVNEGAARFPSALSGLGVLAAAFLFGRRAYGPRRALVAVAVAATLPLFLVFSRLVIMDMTLAFFVCLAIFCGYLAEEREGPARTAWHLAGSAASAMATLVKGPIGFILPWLVLALFFLADRRPRAILRLLAPANLAVLFGLVLPWFIALSQARPDFPHYGIVVESLNRFTTGVFRRRQPVYYYAPLIAAACFAWSVLLPESIAAAWRARRTWSRADRLCIVWSCAVIVFFSLPQSKQPVYILSIAVPLGFLIARLFTAAMDRPGGPAARAVQRGTAILAMLGVGLTVALVLIMARPLDAGRWFHADPPHVDQVLPHLRPLIGACLLLAAGALWAVLRRSARMSFAMFTAFVPALVLAGYPGLVEYGATRSTRHVAESVPALAPGTELVFLASPASLPFYLQRTGTLVTENGHELSSNYIAYMLKSAALWPSNVVHPRAFNRWLSTRDRSLYLIGRGRTEARIREIAASARRPVDSLPEGYCGVLLPAPDAAD